MKIAFTKYELTPKTAIRAHAKRYGALLRFDFNDGTRGFADCHPWIEAGDETLDNQLKLLKSGTPTALMNQSIAFAKLDAEARTKSTNLFEGLVVPPSHFFIPNLLKLRKEDLINAYNEGFTSFKVKLGDDLKREFIWIRMLLTFCKDTGCSARLDFNQKLDFTSFEHFCLDLKPWESQIEFCEDPYKYESNQWALSQRDRIPLACDHNSHEAINKHTSATLLVIKPAVQALEPFFNSSQHFVVTSYLDHPFGQLCAAYSAAKLKERCSVKVRACGLQSHRAYEENDFSKELAEKGPHFKNPNGYGFGFDKLLNKQMWTCL